MSVPPSMEAPKAIQPDEDDLDDLDDLLDDFADDILDKPPGSEANNSTSNGMGSLIHPGSSGRDESTSTTGAPLNNNVDFSKEMRDAQEGLGELLKEMQIEDPEAKKQFETLLSKLQASEDGTEGAPDVGGEAKPNMDFNSVMKETMERLKENGQRVDESIKKEQPEDLLAQLLQGIDQSGEGDFDMSKLLVDMLDQLSSKEILYEPLKELSEKFPPWLVTNKAKITTTEHDSYQKQLSQIQKIVEIFESSTYDDNNKNLRDQINEDLEILQGLGQPPKELMGDGIPGLNFDDDEIPDDLEGQLDDNCKQQ